MDYEVPEFSQKEVSTMFGRLVHNTQKHQKPALQPRGEISQEDVPQVDTSSGRSKSREEERKGVHEEYGTMNIKVDLSDDREETRVKENIKVIEEVKA